MVIYVERGKSDLNADRSTPANPFLQMFLQLFILYDMYTNSFREYRSSSFFN